MLLISIVSRVLIPALLYAYPYIYTINSASGANLLALSYAIWNYTNRYLPSASIPDLFRTSRLLSRSRGSVERYSYSTFLVHSVVCVGAQAFADG
jgi:hypothetical protein